MADSDSGCVSASADDKARTTDDLSIPTFLDRTAEAPSTDDNARRVCWRDHLPVHPAADLFPLMSESELRELGEDIKANGLFSPIVIADEMVLDGRNRLDAMELVGIKFEFIRDHKGKIIRLGGSYLAIHCGNVCGGVTQAHQWWDNPYDFVLAANLHRRHLTADQKRDLIVKVLKAKPEESNRQIAKQVKADDKTVASVRRDLESTAEIPQLEKTTGADGKQRKSRAKKKPKPVYNKLPVDPYAVGDACVVAALEAESAVERQIWILAAVRLE
jgi:hypothetical protein